MSKVIEKQSEEVIFSCTIDCSNCPEFVEPKKLVTFFRQTIKVDGKAGNTKSIEVKSNGSKVTISTTSAKLCKRYMKYLTKKFLKKNNLRDWLRVVSDKKDGFELKFFNVDQDEEVEADEE
ncbi:Large ribosomal subunit protein eL22 [Entamoeba marina]